MKLFLILIMCSFFGAQAYGDDLNSLDAASYEYNSKAFQKTVSLCSEVTNYKQNFEVNLGMLGFFFKGVGSGIYFWGPNGLTLTASTGKLITSPGFKAALYKCFPESPFMRKAFVATVITDDYLGHGIGMATWLIPIGITAKIFGLAIAAPIWVTRVVTAALVGYVGWKGYTVFHSTQNQGDQLSKMNDDIVDNSELAAESSLRLLYLMLQDTNEQLGTNPDAVTRSKLMAKKTYLEGRIYFETHRTDITAP